MTKVEDFVKNPDLLVLTGSKLYGLSTPSSDDDYRGFVVPPKEYLVSLNIGGHRFDQYDGEGDTVIYNVRKYIEMLYKGNLQALELLFAPESHIVECSDIGKKIISQRNMFISKRYYRSIMGFASAEFRKARGVRAANKFASQSEEDLFTQFCGQFSLKNTTRDNILKLVEEDIDRKIVHEVSIKPQIGERRKDDIDRCGFSCKNASHAVRLLYEGIDLFSTGQINFPLRPENALYCMALKNGEIDKEHFINHFRYLESTFNSIVDDSTIQNSANESEIFDFFMELI